MKGISVQTAVLKNFSVSDLLRDDQGMPKKGTTFDRWINRSEPLIDDQFIDYAWGSMAVLLYQFNANGTDDLLEGQIDIEKLHICIDLVAILLPNASLEMSPLDFLTYLLDFELPNNMNFEIEFNLMQLMGAFMVISIDRAITGLLTSDAKNSARYALFVGIAMDIIATWRVTDLKSHTRKIALQFHAKSPKRAEKEEVFLKWKEWQSKPYQYDGKADFAREMLKTLSHLTSQKVIEDWCRLWEKDIGSLPAD